MPYPISQYVASTASATPQSLASRLMIVFNTFTPRLTPADKNAGKQFCNTFLGFGQFGPSRNDVQMQLHVGSTTYPQRPCKGYVEMFYRLLRSLGILTSQAHAITISRTDFDTNSFVFATNTENTTESLPRESILKVLICGSADLILRTEEVKLILRSIVCISILTWRYTAN